MGPNCPADGGSRGGAFLWQEIMTRGRARSPEEIERGLQALAEHGGNAEAASRDTGIPATTLRGWKTQFVDEFVEVRREKRTDFIDEVWETAKEAVKQVKAKIKEASAKEAAIIAGIFIDKALVMGGEPDTIGEMRVSEHRSDVERKLREAVEASPEGDVPQEPDG